MRHSLFAILLLLLFVPSGLRADDDKHTFAVGQGTFLLDGEPFVVKAAELHYPRIPKPYWDQRIKLCKALGMNTVCLYVFWNVHEAKPDVFDFTGQNDLAAFCRLCQDNGMYVILRPGPYVCAEWEMGGLPWWLLKRKDIRLREDDEYFLSRVEKFQAEVARQVADLTIDRGGPIIMVQVENEYGSYGVNPGYVARVRDIVRSHFGSEITLFQCDWASNFTLNGLPDLLWTMNFGTGADIDRQFERRRELRPDSPLMCSEFWSGWFDKWGANHETRAADAMIAGIDEMLSKGISFSLYMTHGGTNWGHWAGSNSPGYQPDVTSYDYDAPISESGQTTPKYFALRQTLAKYMNGEKQARVPKAIPTIAVKPFQLTEVAPLMTNLPEPHAGRDIHSMEDYDQGFGSILYRSSLPELTQPAVLTINEAHDYAQVYVDGRLIGHLDRRLGERQIVLPPCNKGARLDILVEAMGRINFGRAIKDYKGITENVTISIDLGGYQFTCDLKNWQVYNLPDEYEFYSAMTYQPVDATPTDELGQPLPGVYRGTFNLKKTGDTFLDFSTWGKGLVYVNGRGMGRIWSIGPQQTLYVPGCWLQEGDNEVMVVDITGPSTTDCQGLRTAVIDQLNLDQPATHNDESLRPDLAAFTPALRATLDAQGGWQELRFDQPATGRYLCLEALDAHDAKSVAAIAELYLLDAEGQRLPREGWTVVYADSEDVDEANHSADKLFDLQESTYWSTTRGSDFPHMVVIDLGSTSTVTALQYLPRMEAGSPGHVHHLNAYVYE